MKNARFTASLFLSIGLFATAVIPITISTAQAADYGSIDEWGQSPYRVVQDYHAVYKEKIRKVWSPPRNSKGAYVKVRVSLSPDGLVRSVKIQTLNDELRLSMESAINSAQPYRLPLEKTANRKARGFEATFFVE